MIHSELLADQAVLGAHPSGATHGCRTSRVSPPGDPYIEQHGKLKGC